MLHKIEIKVPSYVKADCEGKRKWNYLRTVHLDGNESRMQITADCFLPSGRSVLVGDASAAMDCLVPVFFLCPSVCLDL